MRAHADTRVRPFGKNGRPAGRQPEREGWDTESSDERLINADVSCAVAGVRTPLRIGCVLSQALSRAGSQKYREMFVGLDDKNKYGLFNNEDIELKY